MFFEVLLEGASDAPAVREVMERRFGLVENQDFRLHPHRGRGRLPKDLVGPPEVRHQGLLDQLPAKLRGWSWCGGEVCVLVVIDVDDDPCVELLAQLNSMLERLPKRPAKVLFRLAIEETESWFLADERALKSAFPRLKQTTLGRHPPDAIVGAWELLADALGIDKRQVTGSDKYSWAQEIAPHLELDQPRSPSLRKLVEGVARELESGV